MADSRKRLTTEEVLKFFNGDESSNESDSEQEESFSEYIGTVLPECESDGSFSDQVSSGSDSSANDLLELEAQTTSHEPAATGDKQGKAERDKTQHDDTQEELDSKFHSVYPWDSSDSEASVSSKVESASESQHHADESSDNESVQLSETSTSESGTDSTASEDDEATDNGRTTLRGRGQARSGGLGRGSGGRGRGSSGRGQSRTGQGSGRRTSASNGTRGRQHRSWMDYIPRSARSIAVPDSGFQQPDEFLPLRNPGPQLPPRDLAELDLFRLFIDDATLDRLVVATNAYAESKKTVKRIMYRRCLLLQRKR